MKYNWYFYQVNGNNYHTQVVVYNDKYFRVFTKKGDHVGGGKFSSLSLPSNVLFMKFFSDSINVSVHWSGDQVCMIMLEVEKAQAFPTSIYLPHRTLTTPGSGWRIRPPPTAT